MIPTVLPANGVQSRAGSPARFTLHTIFASEGLARTTGIVALYSQRVSIPPDKLEKLAYYQYMMGAWLGRRTLPRVSSFHRSSGNYSEDGNGVCNHHGPKALYFKLLARTPTETRTRYTGVKTQHLNP
jgi:hypothetical protein